MIFLVATTSLPAVDRPNDDRWNAARSCQLDVLNGHVKILPPNAIFGENALQLIFMAAIHQNV